MPTRFPTQEEIEAKRSALLKKIAIGKRAEQDLAKLEESVKAIAALIEISDEGSRDFSNVEIMPGVTLAVSRPKRKFTPLASFAEAAIRKHGKLHIDKLMGIMNEMGWVSTGDYKLDMKNVFNSLSVNKKFVNLGRNVWDLTEKYQEKS